MPICEGRHVSLVESEVNKSKYLLLALSLNRNDAPFAPYSKNKENRKEGEKFLKNPLK